MKKFPQIKLDERDILAISFAAIAIAWFAQVGVSYWFSRSCNQLATGSRTFVQEIGGNAFVAEPKHPDYRDPAVVKNFVKNWVTILFTWSGQLAGASGKEPIRDPGVPLASGKKVPTNAANAAFAMTASRREQFLESILAEGWIPEDYFSGDPTTTVLEIDELGEPLLVDPDRQIYSVKVVASIANYRDGQPTGKVDYYRQEVIVAPIPIPQTAPAPNASIYEQLSYEWRKRGMQIQETNPLPFLSK